MARVATKSLDSASEFVRGFDKYGQPVTLNINGSETYQTFPGGVITLGIYFMMIMYCLLKFFYMVEKQEWSLIN